MIVVNFYATLRQIVGDKSVEFDLPDGITARQLLDEIVTRFPTLKRELLDEKGQLYSHVHFVINGRDVPYLDEGEDTRLTSEDNISVFPAVGGG